MNGTKTRIHITILVMRIFSYDLFKLFDSLFLPFFSTCPLHASFRCACPLIYISCSFGFNTFATYNLEVVSFSFHPNALARYIINKGTLHLLLNITTK